MSYKSTKLHRHFFVDEIITIHYFEYTKNFTFSGERHNFWELMYVDCGSVQVSTETEKYILNTGNIIFHKPNEFHSIRSIGNNGPNLIVMSFTCNSPDMHFFNNKICTIENHQKKLLSNLILLAKESFKTPIHIPSIEQVIVAKDVPHGNLQLIALNIEMLLISLYSTKSCYCQDKNTSDNSQITNIINFLENNIYERISINDICKEFHISKSSLQVLFKKEKQCGVIQYFKDMKILKARYLIREGSINFTEIAYLLSYSSLQHFSKQFKLTTGMSPLDYQNSIKSISTTFSDKS